MKYLLSVLTFIFLTVNSFAQKETYDFVTYTPPKGWKKEVKANTYTSYTIINKQKKDYCQIYIMLSTAGKGNIIEDFESEWQGLIAKQYNVIDTPQTTELSTANGWQMKDGKASFVFNNRKSAAMLTTMSGYNKAISIVAVTNSDDYIPAIQQLLGSIEMKKPETAQIQQQQNTNNQSGAQTSLLKYNWKQTRNHKDALNNYAGYSSNTYEFRSNGTYKFSRVDFQNYTPKYYMEDEEGTYQVNGDKITITPKKSYFHTHQQQKNDPVLKSEKLSLQVVQYIFQNTIINEKETLLLTPVDGKETRRDGVFSFWLNGEKTKSYSYPSVVKDNTQGQLR